MAFEKETPRNLDVIVIGAGISGINAGYHLQNRSPNLSYTILEGRHELGGTWSLFRYPGIRSDSDLHTFGFSWEPWNQPSAIAEADLIRDYLQMTVKKHHIDEKIQYEHFVNKLNWSTSEQRWSMEVEHKGQSSTYKCKYIIMGTGYYDYKQPLEARIPGLDNFKGQVIHPQFWPEDLDYTGKKIIIVGSGATAVTLLPNLAKKAEMVTQVQRSPSYLLVLPARDTADAWIKANLPTFISKRLIRMKYIVMSQLMYHFCIYFPNAARKVLRKGTMAQLPGGTDVDPHFKPAYNPWEQRMCVTPGGDYFEAYRNGKADIKTDHIQTVTEDGMILKSGEKLEADIIITATGLKMQVGGGAQIAVDGKQLNLADKFMWRGAMLQDVPNLWYVIGYANASWTLAADASARLATRMMNSMEASGRKSATPYLTPDQQQQMDKDNVPLLPLKSTYVNSAMDRRTVPRAGKTGNWKPRYNYFIDMFRALYGNITSGMQYT